MLNPLAHLDPMGAMVFLLSGFGWAKPVPVNPGYFRDPKVGMLLTAAAGPLSNLILAIFAYIGLTLLAPGNADGSVWSLLSLAQDGAGSPGTLFLIRFLGSFLFVNLSLMAFNLLPIAPLDGCNVVRAFIPLRSEDRFEEIMRYGPYILLALLLADAFLGVTILSDWIGAIMDLALHAMTFVFGG
jgi:Zn-dependent protease